MRHGTWKHFGICLFSVGCLTEAKTPASEASGYTYVPIDSLAVTYEPADSCNGKRPYRRFLDALPDNNVRSSVEKFDTQGNASYLTASASVKTGVYRLTTDYVNSDTVPIRMWIKKEARYWNSKKRENEYRPLPGGLSERVEEGEKGTERYVVRRTQPEPDKIDEFEETWVPVHVGIGLRVTARVITVDSDADLGGLGAVGVSAEAGYLSGDLIVQTLGVNGEGVTAALPIQSELNRTTVASALIAVSSIKTLLRDSKQTVTSLRAVGMYLPFRADTALVNAIISALARERIVWYRPCGSMDDLDQDGEKYPMSDKWRAPNDAGDAPPAEIEPPLHEPAR